MNMDDIREMIKETYLNFKWYRPNNILFAILHFGEICRLAAVGVKILIVYGISLERLRDELKNRKYKKEAP